MINVRERFDAHHMTYLVFNALQTKETVVRLRKWSTITVSLDLHSEQYDNLFPIVREEVYCRVYIRCSICSSVGGCLHLMGALLSSYSREMFEI